MLGKLFKYDFKNLFRQMLPFYILVLGSAVVFALCYYLPTSNFRTILLKLVQPIMIGVECSMMANSLIRAWIRYKLNFYGDESYLTHTLPVTKSQLFASKVISTTVIFLISSMVLVIAIILTNLHTGFIDEVIAAINSIAEVIGISGANWGITFVTLAVLEIVSIMLSGFLGITAGLRFENNKGAKGFLFGFVAWGISQLIVFGCMIATRIFWPETALFFTNGAIDPWVIIILMYAGGVGYLISATAECIITYKLLKSGVNVE